MKRQRKEILREETLWKNPSVPDPEPIVTDPNGSYTGRPRDPFEKPVQDADDL